MCTIFHETLKTRTRTLFLSTTHNLSISLSKLCLYNVCYLSKESSYLLSLLHLRSFTNKKELSEVLLSERSSERVCEHSPHSHRIMRRYSNVRSIAVGPLQLVVTWYKIYHAGEQATHWDIKNKENANLS